MAPPRGLSQHLCTLWASWVTPSFASEQLELSRRHLRCKHNTQILSTSEAGAAVLPGEGGSARWPRPRQDEAVPAGRGQQREPEFGRPRGRPGASPPQGTAVHLSADQGLGLDA